MYQKTYIVQINITVYGLETVFRCYIDVKFTAIDFLSLKHVVLKF